MPSLPDNRIRFPGPKIDFEADVGTTGQDHDNYPAPLAQARFDHLRMALIGLLSQQSSFSEPTQKREGTPWFDLNTQTLRIYKNGVWRDYSTAIQLATDVEGMPFTLQDWYEEVSAALSTFAPEVCFGGTFTEDGTLSLTIPSTLQSKVHPASAVFLYVNGQFYDPRAITLSGSPYPTTITLPSEYATLINRGAGYFVNIRKIPISTFYTADVPQP
jgi:hypothetical protein